MYLHFGWEGAQHLALGQIQTLDGYTVNVFLCQYVREELNLYAFRHDLNVVGMTKSATDGQRISETGIVQWFGIYGTNAVQFIRRSIYIHTVRHVVDLRNKVEVFRDNASRPTDGHTLTLTIIIEELQTVRLDSGDCGRNLQLLFQQTFDIRG